MSEHPEEYSEAETARRREAGLKKLLATPPKPHKPVAAKPAKVKPAK